MCNDVVCLLILSHSLCSHISVVLCDVVMCCALCARKSKCECKVRMQNYHIHILLWKCVSLFVEFVYATENIKICRSKMIIHSNIIVIFGERTKEMRFTFDACPFTNSILFVLLALRSGFLDQIKECRQFSIERERDRQWGSDQYENGTNEKKKKN